MNLRVTLINTPPRGRNIYFFHCLDHSHVYRFGISYVSLPERVGSTCPRGSINIADILTHNKQFTSDTKPELREPEGYPICINRESMVTEVASSPHQAVGVNLPDERDDPFASTTPQTKPQHPHRYSSFDTHLYAQNRQTSSPSQAKRSLEAHLAETDRRLQEASKLGTTLVQQRKNLSERLREVEKHQADEEIGPELRQKLAEIEKEYTEVSRESVRAFLGPKTTDPGEASSAPFALDGRVRACVTLRHSKLMCDGSILLVRLNSLEMLLIRRRSSMFPGNSGINQAIEHMTLTSQQRSLHL